jgi:hypothetical protein
MNSMSDDQVDRVGPGYPPKSKRFPKGNSGNTRGRRKGVRNKKTVLKEIASERRSLGAPGNRREVFTFQLLVGLLHKAALNGNLQAVKAMDEFREYLEPEVDQSGGVIVVPEAPESLEKFERLAEAHRQVILREQAKFEEKLRGDDEDE